MTRRGRRLVKQISKGSRDAWKRWKMAFSGGTYFSRSMRDGERLYRESNRNMIDKVRVGNF